MQGRARALVLSFVAGVIALGGLALGSNMGFQITVPIASGAGVSPKYDNWLSIPLNNPYPKANSLCAGLGLVSTGPNASRGVVSRLICSTGVLANYTCGSATVGAFALVKGEGVKVRNPVAISSPLFGSHDPTFAIPLCGDCFTGASPKSETWVSVPYHFVGKKADAICNDAGLYSGTSCASVVSRLIPSSGGLANYTCGSSTLGAFTLTIGEAVKIRVNGPAGGVGPWVPSHW